MDERVGVLREEPRRIKNKIDRGDCEKLMLKKYAYRFYIT